MTRRKIAAAVLIAALAGSTLVAAPAKRPPPRADAFDALVRCRTIADDAERLRCFDEAAAEMERAAEARDLVVLDRKHMRETKRKLFGLDIPDLNPFGGGDSEEDLIKSIESEVASAFQDGNGRWVVRLKDGGTWGQTDNNPIALRPRPGQKVKIERGAMGSYRMQINKQPAVRAKRQI